MPSQHNRRFPASKEVEMYLYERRNWGRWGEDDQVGAINLITRQKLLSALSIPNSGSRNHVVTAHPDDSRPRQPKSG
jgi:hypothetical protein